MFTNDEKKLLEELEIDNVNNLSDDGIVKIENIISNFLQSKGFDKNYKLTEEGKLAESILDKISEY